MVVGQIPDGSSAATPAPATGSHTPSLRRGRARDHTPARPPAGSRGVQGSGHSVDRQELMGTPDPEARLFPRGKRRAGGAEHPQLSTHGTPGSGRGHAPTRRYFRPLGGGGPQRVRPHVRQETHWPRPHLVPLGTRRVPWTSRPFPENTPPGPADSGIGHPAPAAAHLLAEGEGQGEERVTGQGGPRQRDGQATPARGEGAPGPPPDRGTGNWLQAASFQPQPDATGEDRGQSS